MHDASHTESSLLRWREELFRWFDRLLAIGEAGEMCTVCGVFADWLEERGDERAKAVMAWGGSIEQEVGEQVVFNGPHRREVWAAIRHEAWLAALRARLTYFIGHTFRVEIMAYYERHPLKPQNGP